MTVGHGVMREGAATRGRAGSTRVVTSGVLTRIGVPVRRDVASGAQGVMTAVPAPEAVSVMTAGAVIARTVALVLRAVPSAGRTVIGTIVVGLLAVTVGRSAIAMIVALVLRAVPSVGRSGIGMIVVPGVRVPIVGRVRRVLLVSVARTVGATTGVATVALVPRVATVALVVRVARAGLRSVRGTIAAARRAVSVGRSGTGTTALPGVKASTADLAARAVTAPTGDLVLRAALSVGRSGIVTTGGLGATSGPIVALVVRARRVVSADRTVIAMIVGRAARVARVGLRSARGTIVGVRPVVRAGRSAMTVVPAGKADIRAMTGRGRSHGTHVMSVPTVAPARGTAGTTVRRTPRRASRCPSLSRTSRLTSSTRKCARSSGPCPTTWRSWSAGT
jgi:hypothetical protein